MNAAPWKPIVVAVAGLIVGACASVGRPSPGQPQLRAADPAGQVRETELAFAKTMADRDFPGFVAYLSKEAIFFADSAIRRGPDEIAAAWQPFFSDPTPPFSWQPDHVEVLPSGRLALSTGPVYADGRVVGRFNSVWRLEGHNRWRIVFDKGETICAKP
jgi:ketosteroid isomerase-like protein